MSNIVDRRNSGQKQLPRGVLQKFCKIHRKTPVQKYQPYACNFFKNKTPTQVFSCDFCEISRTPFFKIHFTWLLLRVFTYILCFCIGYTCKRSQDFIRYLKAGRFGVHFKWDGRLSQVFGPKTLVYFFYTQKQPRKVFCKKRCFQKFYNSCARVSFLIKLQA